MTIETFGVIVGIIIAISSMCVTSYGVIWRQAQLELKVDLIWDFLIKRAMAEAVHVGAATMNSPLVIKEETREWFKDITPELQEFYHLKGFKLTDQALALEIERIWGEKILKDICIPYKLHQGACLIIAQHIAKGK